MNDKPKTDEAAEKLKAKEAAEKLKAEEAAKEAELDELQKAQQTPDKALDPASAKVAKAIMESDVDANTVETDIKGNPIVDPENTTTTFGELDPARAKGEAAYLKLRRIGVSYQRQTPDEHIIFGAGGVRYTLGDLRDLLSLPR